MKLALPRRSLLAALILGSLLLAGSARQTAVASADSLSWHACGRFECATLSVPLDYAAPEGQQIELALMRQPAGDQSNRIGSLLVNPGGPGGSGLDFLQGWAPSLPREVRDRFDIVSFDPRGVGQSTPLVCHDNIQQLAGLDPSPDSDAAWSQVESVTQAFADNCAQKGADLLPFIGTESVVRDMDSIRTALGEDKISYFGYSYGTELGAVYADLFPQHLRAMVLDGPVDISLSPDEMTIQQSIGFENAFSHYVADCADKSCLDGADNDPEAMIDGLLQQVETQPIPAPQADRPAGPGETLLAIVVSLYSKSSWPRLTSALNQAIAGDGSGLVRLADTYLGRNPDGSYGNLMEVNAAVNCVDKVSSRDPEHYIALAQEWPALAPHFGASGAEGELICAYWSADPTPVTTPTGAGAPPILVVGTSADPATPYPWAIAMSRQLKSAELLTNYGEGHTAYRSGSACVDDFVDKYLLSVKLPPVDSSCGDAAASPAPVFAAPQAGSPAPQAPVLVTSAHTDQTHTIELAAGVFVLALLFAGGLLALIAWRRV